MRYLLALATLSLTHPLYAKNVSRVPNRFETLVQTDAEKKIPGEKEMTALLVKGITENLGANKHRDAHAKAHGCVGDIQMKVEFDEDLDPEVRKKLELGYFKNGKLYRGVARISAGPGRLDVDDRQGGAQGFALKLFLDGKDDQAALLSTFGEDKEFVASKYYKTFDIVTINRNREFFVSTMYDYPDFFKASGLAGKAVSEAVKKATLEKKTPEEIKKIIKDTKDAVLTANYFEVKGKKPRLTEKKLIERIENVFPKNLLAETYNSWVPSLLGQEAVKYEIAPCEKVDPDAYEMPAGISDREDPNFLAKVLKYELRKAKHCYVLRVQLHQEGFPSVEKAEAEWPEDKSKYIKVATISIPQREEGKELIDSKLCEAMSFNPSHASAIHYPIGSVQRARVGGVEETTVDGKTEQKGYEGIYSAIHRHRNL